MAADPKRHPYYRDWLAFLYEGGEALARANPQDADMLAHYGDDPDVERLLEGIAFFVGKINERQVQNLSQLCQFLFDILFPYYLCPVPATSVVEFRSEQWVDTLPRGTEIGSVPVRGTSCRFRSCFEVDISPLTLDSAHWERTSRGGSLTLYFSKASALERSTQLEKDRLRLHLHGEPRLNDTLYHWFLTQLDGVDFVDESGESLFPGEGVRVKAVGLDEEDALLVFPEGSFAGFRLVQEYFTLAQKFRFIDIEGIWSAQDGLVPPGDSFGVRFHFKLGSSQKLQVNANHFRLGCTPVANHFPHEADPVLRSPSRDRVRLRPAGFHRHLQVYRVLSVQGVSPAGEIAYPVLSELDLNEGNSCSQILRSLSPDNEVVIDVHLTDPDRRLPPDDQTIMADLLCTNGSLPLGLHLGDINRPPEGLRGVTCRNITNVQEPTPVPMGEELRQRLINHLSLTQTDLCTLRGIQQTLELYHLQVLGSEQARRRQELLLDGMLQVDNREFQDRYQGIPVRGRSTTLEVADKTFASEGELFLFGTIINELVALQSPVNWISQFAIRWTKTKKTYTWPKRLARLTLTS